MISIRAPRTVRQIPERHAARFEPTDAPRALQKGLFHISRQILLAETDQERAAILLRVSDAAVSSKGGEMKEACKASGFTMGATFIELRLAALTAVRDREGRLPEQHLISIETWRRGFVALAHGEKA